MLVLGFETGLAWDSVSSFRRGLECSLPCVLSLADLTSSPHEVVSGLGGALAADHTCVAGRQRVVNSPARLF